MVSLRPLFYGQRSTVLVPQGILVENFSGKALYSQDQLQGTPSSKSNMILSLKEICKSFGSRQVLNSVSLVCDRGEICGLIGPNGAGKSTLFRIILGLVSPDSGSIKIPSSAKKAIGGIIDKPALYGYLSAYDNLRVFAALQGIELNDTMYLYEMDRVGLDPDRTDPVRNYSMGMKQRLGLAIALINQPECIILDEPFSGLDPMGARALHRLILNLAKETGIAVLVSSHNLVELGELCDTLYIINNGIINEKKEARALMRDAARVYVLYGNNLEKSEILQELSAEFRSGIALVDPGSIGIESVIKGMVQEGTDFSACVPQSDLKSLFTSEKK